MSLIHNLPPELVNMIHERMGPLELMKMAQVNKLERIYAINELRHRYGQGGHGGRRFLKAAILTEFKTLHERFQVAIYYIKKFVPHMRAYTAFGTSKNEKDGEYYDYKFHSPYIKHGRARFDEEITENKERRRIIKALQANDTLRMIKISSVGIVDDNSDYTFYCDLKSKYLPSELRDHFFFDAMEDIPPPTPNNQKKLDDIYQMAVQYAYL